jgi:hypothetical protein
VTPRAAIRVDLRDRPLRTIETAKQPLRFFPLHRLNHIIGIDPDRMITSRMRERLVARRREVVDPLEIKHPRPELTRNFLGPIPAAGI